MSKTIKVLIADDSAFMRLLISDIISEDKEIEVIGTAVDGNDAAIKVSSLKPDVLLLDMNMGEFDGLYAVKRVMEENPIPILILSSVGNTNLQPIFDALRCGAVDYINKPQRGSSKVREIEDELVNKIKSAARARPKANTSLGLHSEPDTHEFTGSDKYDIIVIGASTGGPSAIEEIISDLPANLNVPVIVCQHMPANFIQPFVKRLNNLSSLNVVLGGRAMAPKAGMVIIAPGDGNVVIEKDSVTGALGLGYTKEQFREYNNPSINALMLSVARHYGAQAIGVILTGMGKDGVNGLKAIKDEGGYTVAQSEQSSVIYGMPKVAVEKGAVTKTLDIKDIGPHLIKRL